MDKRTREQILDEAVFAIACVHEHYCDGLSAEGLSSLRNLLGNLPLEPTVENNSDYDYHNIIRIGETEAGHEYMLNFDTVIKKSKTGVELDLEEYVKLNIINDFDLRAK